MCRLTFSLTLSLLSLLCLTRAQPQSDSCAQDGATLLCRGERALRNVLINLGKSDKPLVIMRGLEIVPAPAAANAQRMDEPTTGDEPTLLDSLALYLRTHEVNLKLADLLDETSGQQAAEARKKDKGQGMLLAMALMFGKMMAVMGIGGIGALAMKALGVAMMALMMAGLLGLKSVAQQGHESSHSISYVTGEGHHHHKRRRRRAAAAAPILQVVNESAQPLAYRNWSQ
ncbi:Osi5 [Drosophila busckii]|uniref:Osi5 n=1 Tax=Drosophila busckii TaxID=30019 RepID=A0A0M4F5L4_DROBS|nr:uncharacterized protein LOC108601462 [Drosophila busckii]ALC46832.1 Osi5 [Drosophila busckii]